MFSTTELRWRSGFVAVRFLLAFSLLPLTACDAPTAPGHTIEVFPEEVLLVPGGSSVLRVFVVSNDGRPIDFERGEVRWASTDEGVLTVSGAGRVTAHSSGAATVEASYRGAAGSAEIEVEDPTLEVTGGGQTGIAATTLAGPVVVVIRGADGSPLEGVRLEWGTRENSGWPSKDVTSSGPGGRSWVTWTLGVVSGLQELEVRAGSLARTITAQAIPGIAELDPDRAAIMDTAFQLTVTGAGFSEGSMVEWNGEELATTFHAHTRLTARVAGTALERPGAASVVVSDPAAAEPSSPAEFWVLEPLPPLPEGLRGRITAQAGHTCAVAADSSGYCWGNDAWGQLGNGDAGLSPWPSRISGDHDFVLLSAGGGGAPAFTCGLDQTGAAYCWGATGLGQVGQIGMNDLWPPRLNTPQPVDGAREYVSMEAGRSHVCALTPAGEVYCWGTYCAATEWECRNHPVMETPTRVEWHEPFAAVTSGGGGSCALTRMGTAVCWGRGKAPAAVDRRPYKALSRGAGPACGLSVKNETFCWLSGGTPGQIQGAPAFVSITAGGGHTCGLTAEGAASCWGLNDAGQLGVGTTTSSLAPLQVNGPQFAAIDAGIQHTCAVTMEGTVYCWGKRGSGRLGDGWAEFRAVPRPVAGDHSFTRISRTCGLAEDGTPWCWGDLPDRGTRSPVALISGDPMVEIAAGSEYAAMGVLAAEVAEPELCGLTGEGAVRCGTSLMDAVPLPFKAGSLVSGAGHRCALSESGEAYCWGLNDRGQLGNGTTEPSDVAVRVAGDLTFAQLAAGHEHTCGLTSDGSAYCWGMDAWSNLGVGKESEGCAVYNGGVDCSQKPIPVDGGHTFDRLWLGGQTSCGKTVDGKVLCWGSLPNGDYTCASYLFAGSQCMLRPTEVLSQLAVAEVSPGYEFACAITTGGAAYCWGSNFVGQLGTGTVMQSPEPAAVLGNQVFTAIRASGGSHDGHVCALTAEGTAYCWGNNAGGQLGDGTLLYAPEPVQVVGLAVRVP